MNMAREEDVSARERERDSFQHGDLIIFALWWQQLLSLRQPQDTHVWKKKIEEWDEGPFKQPPPSPPISSSRFRLM